MHTPSPSRPFFSRLHERMAASRFLTFSLLIHAIIVILGGGAVIMTGVDRVPDFVSTTIPAEPDLVRQPVDEEPLNSDPVLPQLQTATPVAVQELVSAETVTSAGHVMVGFSLSVTVTVNEQVFVLPLPSVTTNRLVVVPFKKVAPLVSPAVCVSTAPGQLSLKGTV